MKTDRYTIYVGRNDCETKKQESVLVVRDEVDSYLIRNTLK